MNWPRSKTCLIVLFLCVNLFLAYYMITGYIDASYLDARTIKQTAGILSKNGISVDIESIPTYIPSLAPVEMQNALSDDARLADMVFHGGYTKVSESLYTKGNKSLRLDGDMIEYKNEDTGDTIGELNADNAADTVRTLFAGFGFDVGSAECTLISSDGGVYTVHLTQTINGYPLFDSQFEVNISREGILYFSGSWFVPSPERGLSGAPESITSAASALIDFISDHRRNQNGSNVITGIAAGYTTGEKNIYHKAVTAMPVWQIATDDGNLYYYNAR